MQSPLVRLTTGTEASGILFLYQPGGGGHTIE